MFSWLWDCLKKPKVRSERRASHRYLCNADADLRWHDTTGQVRVTRALVFDVSMSGVAVMVDQLPEGQAASIRLMDRPASDWLDAEIIHIEAAPKGPHLIRLRFSDTISYSFFRSALPGVQLDVAGPTYESPLFDPRDWR